VTSPGFHETHKCTLYAFYATFNSVGHPLLENCKSFANFPIDSKGKSRRQQGHNAQLSIGPFAGNKEGLWCSERAEGDNVSRNARTRGTLEFASGPFLRRSRDTASHRNKPQTPLFERVARADDGAARTMRSFREAWRHIERDAFQLDSPVTSYSLMQSAELIESVDRRGNAYKSCRPFAVDLSVEKATRRTPTSKTVESDLHDIRILQPVATIANEGSDEASGSFYLPYGKNKKGNLGSLCTNFWLNL